MADARDRLERQTAEMANRSSEQLAALDAAISRVSAGRERIRLAIEDERVRLDRMELEAARLDGDETAALGNAGRLRHQIEGQLRMLELLEADIARARAGALQAATEHVQARLRAGAARRERRAGLEQSRSEIARSSAEHAAAVATLEATPELPPAADDLIEIATRRAQVDAELAAQRRRRDAIRVPRGAASLADRAWQERRDALDADIARLVREMAALDAAQVEARQAVASHQAMRDSLAREVEVRRSRVLAAHRRYTALEESLDEDDARIARGVAEAEAASSEAAMVVRDLEQALPGERTRLEELRRELDDVERSAHDAARRRDVLRAEVAEERRLRELMRELATIELSLRQAIDERDELERLVGRMRGAAL